MKNKTISIYTAALVITIIGSGAALFILQVAHDSTLASADATNLDVLLKKTN